MDIENKLRQAIEGDRLGQPKAHVSEIGPAAMERFNEFDWQSYLPETVRRLWAELPLNARLVAFICARHAAYGDFPSDD